MLTINVHHALRGVRERGERAEEGRLLGLLGAAWLEQGNAVEAEQCFAQQRQIQEEVRDRQNEVIALDQRGVNERAQGNLAEALRCAEAALALAREIGDRQLIAIVLRNQAPIYEALGEEEEARQKYLASMVFFGIIKDELEGIRTRWAYGQFQIRHGERKSGLKILAESAACEQERGDPLAAEHLALVEQLRAGGDLPT
jgi:tetratricopeptide (TPR) repeat protein